MSRHLAGGGIPPDAFAVVMATGIIAVDAHHQSNMLLDAAMTLIAMTAFGVLIADVAVRTATSPGTPFDPIRRPDTALRLFSFVAACAVLGARFQTHPAMLWALGAVASVGWLILVSLAAADVRSRSFTDLCEDAHGAWLLASVATAGLSITAADLGIIRAWPGWLVLSVVAWLLAAVLYVATVGLIVRRAIVRLASEDVTPDSWILMGALAILTLAAAHLHTTLWHQDVFTALTTAMNPIILTMWILATAWIPVLLAAEVWHFDRAHDPLGIRRTWWSAVFPVGMYSAATQATAAQLQLPILPAVAEVFFWIALGMFVMVSVGWLHGKTNDTRAAA